MNALSLFGDEIGVYYTPSENSLLPVFRRLSIGVSVKLFDEKDLTMAERDQEGGSMGAEGLAPAPLTLKEEMLDRPSSPDTHCSICLGELRNKSYTDSCTHQFCFSCLLQWSKIKPECPLCKQSFRSIYYNIEASGSSDQMEIDTSPVIPPVPDIEPTVLINLAFDRPRFRYRSRFSRTMLYIGNLIGGYSSSSGRRMSTGDLRRRRQLGTSEFRRNIYRQGMWVRRRTDGRVRECSPEFYRLNPAQTHRLVPWLNRELNVLLDLSLDSRTVSLEILDLITVYPILSSQFNRAMQRYLGVRTAHFVHEFYSFATSPYDMLAYDIHAEYTSVENMNDPNHFDATDNNSRERREDDDEDSDIEVVVESNSPRNEPGPIMNNLIPVDLSTVPGPSSSSSLLGTEDGPIVISDDEGASPFSASNQLLLNLEDYGNQSDSSVEFLTSLPPRHLRTPEIITISSDDESNPHVEDRVENVVGIPNGDSGEAASTSHPSSISNSVVTEEDAVVHNTRRKKRRGDVAHTLPNFDYSSSEESDRKARHKKTKLKSKSSKKYKKRKTDTHASSSSKIKHSRSQEVKHKEVSSESDFEVNPGVQGYKEYLKLMDFADEDKAQARKPKWLQSVVKVVNSDSSEMTQIEPGFSGTSRCIRRNYKKYFSSSESDSGPQPPRVSKRTKQKVNYYSESSKFSESSVSD